MDIYQTDEATSSHVHDYIDVAYTILYVLALGELLLVQKLEELREKQ